MAVLIVNNTDRRAQYVSGAGDTTFPYPFEIFADGDLDVYQEQIRLTLGVDYTVTNAGLTGGGDVILTVGASLDQIIVIVGNIAIDQLINFTIEANFIGRTVQTQYDKMTMIQQQLDTDLQQRGLQYNVFTTVKENSIDNIIPTLAASQFWQMNSTATGIFAAELEDDPGCSTLRSELISNQSGSDGAKIVGYFSTIMGQTTVHDALARVESKAVGDDGASFTGYFDPSDNTEKTVAEKLSEAHQTTPLKNLIMGGDFSTNPFQRGTTFIGAPTETLPADRFLYEFSGAQVLDWSAQGASPPTVAETGIFTTTYLQGVVTTGASLGIGDFTLLMQKIEGFNWAKIAQRKFTVSFWVRSSLAGTYSLAARSIDANQTNVQTYTVDSVSTWEKKIITFDASPAAGAWNYTNGTGIQIIFTLAAGTNFQTTTLDSWQAGQFIASTSQVNFSATTSNFVDIALVQVEEGENETQFEIRTIGEELALCQRYYYKTYSQGVFEGAIDSNGSLGTQNIGAGIGEFASMLRLFLPVTLRRLAVNADLDIRSPVTGGPGIRNVTSGIDVAATIGADGDNIISVRQLTGSIPIGSDLAAHVTVNVEL